MSRLQLTPEEVDSLRQEMQAAGEWVRQEIKRKSAPQVSITGRETDGNGAEQAQKKAGNNRNRLLV